MAIVVDTLNTIPEDQAAVKAQVMQYLRALAPNTRVAIYSLGSKASRACRTTRSRTPT